MSTCPSAAAPRRAAGVRRFLRHSSGCYRRAERRFRRRSCPYVTCVGSTDRTLPGATAIHRGYDGVSEVNMLWTILIGFVVGLLARAIKPGSDAIGWIMTAVIGVGGAVLATFIGQQLGWYEHGDK